MFWLRTAVAGTCLLLLTSLVMAQTPELSEDSKPQEGVPKGKIVGPIQWKSKIFPGTVRNYWLYVPEQYDPAKKTCVLVLQDGLGRATGWNMIPVLDNLIHKKEIPVQIGIFIEPGVLPAAHDKAQPRFNRSYEYDALGDRYARFLIEEILPEVKKEYNLSDDPNDRAIGGASSGAICAFNVAWERPDQFRRVISTIGTYVGLRGADAFPTLIRKTEPKPIRVFLEDGSGDLNIYAGDWYTANLDMLSALKYSGYEVAHKWGTEGHNNKGAAPIMPEIVRYIWKDYPEPVKAAPPQKSRMDILIDGEKWQEVSSGHKFTEGPAVNRKGEVFFTDIPNGKIHKIGLDGKVSVFVGMPNVLTDSSLAPMASSIAAKWVQSRSCVFPQTEQKKSSSMASIRTTSSSFRTDRASSLIQQTNRSGDSIPKVKRKSLTPESQIRMDWSYHRINHC